MHGGLFYGIVSVLALRASLCLDVWLFQGRHGFKLLPNFRFYSQSLTWAIGDLHRELPGTSRLCMLYKYSGCR